MSLADAELAQLEQVTGITATEWDDLLTLSEADQRQAVADWQALGRMSWVQDPSIFGEAMSLLGIVGTIAGVVGGTAGAIAAIKAL